MHDVTILLDCAGAVEQQQFRKLPRKLHDLLRIPERRFNERLYFRYTMECNPLLENINQHDIYFIRTNL